MLKLLLSIIVDSILNVIFDINKPFHLQIWKNLSELYYYNITRIVFMVFRLFSATNRPTGGYQKLMFY